MSDLQLQTTNLNTTNYLYTTLYSIKTTFMQLFTAAATEQRHQLVYNLAPFGERLVLPEAYLVAVDDNERLTYILRKVQQNNVAALGYPLQGERFDIFQIIENLQVKNIERHFNATQKKPKKLAQFLEDAKTKKKITQYVDNQLSTFLKLVKKSNAILCWDGQKKVRVPDMQVGFGAEKLRAHASFIRTETGMIYRLKLEDKSGIWRIKNKDVKVLTNEPGWVLVDWKIYQLAYISGGMLRPFLQKNAIAAPERLMKTYFNFVRKVATKINIEAEGFAMVEEIALQACVLQLQQNIFDQIFGIQVKMRYRGKDFHYQDEKAQTVAVDFSDAEEVSIRKIHRDFNAEKKFLQQLKDFDLVAGGDNLFRPAVAENPIDIPAWFIEHKKALTAAGFYVEKIQIGDKQIVSEVPKIVFKQTKGLDWLDIHGTVTVGKFEFPFLKLANYIRSDDPFYPLPDGTYFIIPQEWMTRYKGLFQFGKAKEEKLRIHKTQYGLLKNLEADGLDAEKYVEEVEYTPSKHLKATLRPYQLEGVKWLVGHHRNDFGACLADDMGLGKTLQTIALLLYAREQKQLEQQTGETIAVDLFQTLENHVALQALIVLPTSLIYNWESEVQKFAPTLLTYKHVGAKRHKDPRLIQRFDITLTTYQTALRDVELLQQLDWEYIILDESQYIKNKDSKIFKAINTLESAHRLSLSGTPIENSLSDLWAQMQFINKDMLGSFKGFKNAFITPIEKQGNEEKIEQLRTVVQPFLLRRTKNMVAKDLPELTEQIFYSTMGSEQKKLYEKEKSAARNFLLEEADSCAFNYQAVILQSLNKLRQIVNHPRLVHADYQGESAKFNDILEQLQKLEKGNHKTLMFSSFLRYLDLFQAEFDTKKTPYALLNGQLTKKQRQKHIDNFMANENVRHFLISLKAGGTGLNLTAADYVLMLDPWYNPFAENQAIARAHRIGQTRQVIALKFITKDTIEEKILALQRKKAKLADDIIGTGKVKYSKSDLRFLLE